MRSRRYGFVLAAAAVVAVTMPVSAQERTRETERRSEQVRRAEQAAEHAREQRARASELTEKFSRTLRLGRNGTLDLQNLAGHVVITGGRGDEVRIDAVKTVRNPDERRARTLMQQMQVEVIERGGNIEVRTQVPRVPGGSGTVDYTVAVPASANVTVRTFSGDIRVRNINGELRVEATRGNVHASDVRRVRLVKTLSGNIEVANGQSEELTASTTDGNLTLDNLKGRFFDLQSISGHLRLINVDPERVHLRSMAGNIEYIGRLSPSGTYEFSSHTGTIRLTPTNRQGFDIQASTFGGRFRSEYELKITEDSGSGRPTRGTRMLRGFYGDAGAAITAYTMNGDIVLIRRDQ